MFPSAANITQNTNSEENVPTATRWLQSTSFQPPTSVLQSSLDEHRHAETKKKLKKRHQDRLHSPSPPRTPESSLESDFFRLDISSNKNIYKYGSIYEGEVPKFYAKDTVPILGFRVPLRLRDLSPEALKKEAKHNLRKRYFSKKNRSRIIKPGIYVESIGKIETFSDGNSIPLPIDVIPPREVQSSTTSRSSFDLKRVAELNQKVYDSPGSVRTWLELVEIQLDHEEDASDPDRRRLVLLEKQITIVERAIAANAGNLRLRLLLAGLREYATELLVGGGGVATMTTLQQKDLVHREWSQLVFTAPQFVAVWRGFLTHLRGRFATFGDHGETGPASAFVRIDRVYKRALTTLSGIVSGRILSHKPTEGTADQTVDLLAEYCQWLSQAGFTERALSIWRAVIEFSCFCPPRMCSAFSTSLGERREAFAQFWRASSDGVAHFGQTGAQGWAKWFDRGDAGGTSDGPPAASESNVADLDEDWSLESSTAIPRWNRIIKDWNDTAEAAEDALLSFKVKSDENSLAELKPAFSRGDSRFRPGSSLNSHQTRGLAWLGLERARESLGWLPASTTAPHSEVEDSDRAVTFEEVEPCLLEVHLDQTVTDPVVLDKRRQRIILLYLEFLGVWNSEVAREYNLPTDMHLVHELSAVSCLQRQRICPREFGFPWLRPNLESATGTSFIVSQMRCAFIESSLEQASAIFPADVTWQSTLGRLRFDHLGVLIKQALVTKQISPKAALGFWRKRAKAMLSKSASSQADLALWLAFAKALADTACVVGVTDGAHFFEESRKVFNSTLKMYPVPTNVEENLEQQINILLPRLKVLQAFVDFELCVNFPMDTVRPTAESAFSRVSHVIQHAASGGSFTPLIVAQGPSSTSREVLAYTCNRLAERLSALSTAVSTADDQQESVPWLAVAHLAGILASSLFTFTQITLDDNQMAPVCQLILQSLRRIDSVGVAASATSTKTRRSRWSDVASSASVLITTTTGGVGFASRAFLRLALPSLSAVSLFRQQNRAGAIERFLSLVADGIGHEPDDKQLPLLVSPSDWTFLLPFKVAATSGGQISKTCSIEYQRSLQGLLPPLLLSSLQTRLSRETFDVLHFVASHLTATCHLTTMGQRRQTQTDAMEVEAGLSDPASLLGLPSTGQAELLAKMLPSCLDLMLVGLELDHWTSLVAGAADSGASNPMSHCWIQSAVPRIRSAFEKALSTTTRGNLLARFENSRGIFAQTAGQLPSLAATIAPTFWTDHLRTVLWSTYMAFEWTAAGNATPTQLATNDFDSHRRQRTALKAVFYRAIEDVPWAKILYTDLARYCPEDAGEVVDLIVSKQLRLRTPMEEVDLLLTTHLP